MATQLTFIKNFTDIECYNCGVIFYISDKLDDHLRDNKNSFYCPNGHSQAYVKSRADRLQEQLAENDRLLLQKNSEISTLKEELKKKHEPEKETTKIKKKGRPRKKVESEG